MLALIAILIVPLVALMGFLYNLHRKLKVYYDVICKKSSSLKPYDVFGERVKIYGFHEYYYERLEDEIIKKKIENDKNILILGNPLAGKTRAIYQALINLNKPHNVIIPRLVDINPKDLLFPLPICFWRKRILVLDDLDKFAEKRNFMSLFQGFLRRNTLIIACCRLGAEYKKLCSNKDVELSSIFGDHIEMPKISREEGEEVAQKTGRDLPDKFEGNIGSIFMPLDSMRDRFQDFSEVKKGILRAIKRLYYAGIYREREIFFIERIKQVCKKQEIEMKKYEWDEKLNDLEKNGFIEIMKKANVWAEEVYLRYVIKDAFSPLDNLDEMIDIFYNDAEALVSIGSRASYIGLIDIQKAEYMKVAIKAYEKALESYTLEKFPEDYAMTQNNLGNAYQRLADVENKADNCSRAIGAYKEALKVYTLERFPIDYAMTRNNLGNAYQTLAEVEKKAENCSKAIQAYEKALKVRTLERFPMDYATTQNNLGSAYGVLADIEDKAVNCKRAIKSFEEALKLRILERFPMDYATTQNNLGNAYGALAEVEKKEENCKKAIEAFEEALKVRTLERFPMQYATTQNNLGNAYRILSDVENKAGNCKMAIKAFKEALKVYTMERFPMDYAMTQNNLGNAYQRLAEVENKEENCNRAIEAFEEALKVRTLERFSMDYAMTKNNLAAAYVTLAKVEDKAENCRRAIKACKEALKLYTIKRFPMQYADAQNNLGAAYCRLAEVEEKAENCKKAINVYQQALKVRTLERFPMQYSMTQNNLGTAYRTLAEVENKAKNCNNAKEAYEEALKVYTKEDLPQLHNLVKGNLRRLIDFCEGK